MRKSWIVLGCLGVILNLGAPALAGAAATDSWITAKTKMALLTSKDVSGTAVNVDTVDGRVTLHGKVPSADEKAKAESIARGIEGAKEVRNLLQVVPEKREETAKATDADVEKRVKDALKAKASLQDSNISVQSVNQGVVLLAGDAKTMSDHLEAIRTASRVSGVRRVSSEIKSPDTLGDEEIRHMETSKGAADKPGIGDAASDMYITTATKLRLIADSETPALDINVDTTDGVVTLFGIVPSEKAKQAAGADARKVSGVKQVVNELQIVVAQAKESTKANDKDLQQAIEQALEKRYRPRGRQHHGRGQGRGGAVERHREQRGRPSRGGDHRPLDARRPLGAVERPAGEQRQVARGWSVRPCPTSTR